MFTYVNIFINNHTNKYISQIYVLVREILPEIQTNIGKLD